MDFVTPSSLVDLTVRVVALLSLAGLLALVLRGATARLRAGLWSAALIGSLLLPLASSVLPQWKVSILPMASPWLGSGAGDAPVAADVELVRGHILTREALSVPRAEAVPVEESPYVGAATRSRGISWGAVAITVWVTGFIGILLWQGAGLLRLRLLWKRSVAPVNGRTLAALPRCARRLGVHRRVRVAVSSEIGTPVTWGVLRPVILLPEVSERWLLERLEVVLLHELVHIKRYHWPVRMLARAACALYWCNPLTWISLKLLNREMELACDEEVVAAGSRASTYAGHLLEIARSASPRFVLGGAALDMAHRTQLEGRIVAIINRKKTWKYGLIVSIPALLIMAALVPAIAAVDPWAESSDAEEIADVVREFREAEKRLEPYLESLDDLEVDIEPYLAKIEEIEIDLEPLHAEIEARMQPFHERLAEIEIQMTPHQFRMQELELELGPLHEEMEKIHRQMEPLYEQIEVMSERIAEDVVDNIDLSEVQEALHLEMEPFREELKILHESLAPLHEQMESIHVDLGPFHEQMAAMHEEMAPMLEEMQSLHGSLAPRMEELEGYHESMEPLHERMEEFHRQMQPFHEEMEGLGERLEAALGREIRALIESNMAPVTGSDAPFDEAVERVMHEAHIEIDDDGLQMSASETEIREILKDLFEPQRRPGTAIDFSAALDRTARAIADFRVEVN